MSGGDLERVRSDLSAMRKILGLGLPWGLADVWFCGAASAAGGLYALLSWPGSPVEMKSPWAAAPLMGAIAAYLTYMPIKSRRLPPREESRRREYQSTLLALACAAPAIAAYVFWGKHIGMTGMQLRGSALALTGIAFLVVGVACPPAQYPRGYFIVGAVPTIAFGLMIPLASPAYYHSLLGLLCLAGFGLTALVMHRHIGRSLAQEGDHAGH